MLANQMFPAVLGNIHGGIGSRFGFPWLDVGCYLFFPQESLILLLIQLWASYLITLSQNGVGEGNMFLLVAIVMGIAFIIMWQLYKEKRCKL